MSSRRRASYAQQIAQRERAREIEHGVAQVHALRRALAAAGRKLAEKQQQPEGTAK